MEVGVVEKSDIGDRIFCFAYRMAMHDATMMKAYGGEKRALLKAKKPYGVVKAYVDELLDGSSRGKPTVEVISDVKRGFEEEGFDGFTFGNAQKLLNMTVKYLYIGVYEDATLRELFEGCDCPVDSSIIDCVIDDLNGLNDGEFEKLAGIGKGKGWKGQLRGKWSPWSKVEGEDYKELQDVIRCLCQNREEACYPIEYDYFKWGAEA